MDTGIAAIAALAAQHASLPSPANEVSRGPRSYTRSSYACELCHKRKVRCDIARSGNPCTNCTIDKRECTPRAKRKRRSKHNLNRFRQSALPQESPLPHVEEAQAESCESEKSATDSVQCGTPKAVQVADPAQGPRIMKDRHSLYATVPYSDYNFIKTCDFEDTNPLVVAFLECQGCFYLPDEHLLYVFLRHYFLYVHPCLPVINEAQFWRAYRQRGDDKISLLLLRAMIFAAAYFVPFEVMRKYGYESLVSVRKELYQRAKALYDAEIETDPHSLAQSCLLLSYHSETSDLLANSKWLAIALQYARVEHANQYHGPCVQSNGNGSDLKRLWWCCMIRDRIISLGMRRSIQIPPTEFDLHKPPLTSEDLADEINNSEVYDISTKLELCKILTNLCELVVCLTDLSMALYPSSASNPLVSAPGMDTKYATDRLLRLKLSLAAWKTRGIVCMKRHSDEHPSVALNVQLNSMYYEAARIALSNHICSLISSETQSFEHKTALLGESRRDLADAVSNIADQVKILTANGMVTKLPISATAYTALPVVLLYINCQLSNAPDESQRYKESLMCLLEAQQLFAFRHGVGNSLAWADAALDFFRPETIQSAGRPDSPLPQSKTVVRQPAASTLDYLFECRSACYTLFVRYMDLKLSTGRAEPDRAHRKGGLAALSPAHWELEHKPPSLLGQQPPDDFTELDTGADTWPRCDSPSWFLIDSPPLQVDADGD